MIGKNNILFFIHDFKLKIEYVSSYIVKLESYSMILYNNYEFTEIHKFNQIFKAWIKVIKNGYTEIKKNMTTLTSLLHKYFDHFERSKSSKFRDVIFEVSYFRLMGFQA